MSKTKTKTAQLRYNGRLDPDVVQSIKLQIAKDPTAVVEVQHGELRPKYANEPYSDTIKRHITVLASSIRTGKHSMFKTGDIDVLVDQDRLFFIKKRGS